MKKVDKHTNFSNHQKIIENKYSLGRNLKNKINFACKNHTANTSISKFLFVFTINRLLSKVCFTEKFASPVNNTSRIEFPKPKRGTFKEELAFSVI